MTRKIPINEATTAQLRDFASLHLGLDIRPSAKHETVLARVQSAWDKEEIIVYGETEDERQSGPKPEPVTEEQRQKMRQQGDGKIRLLIGVTEEPGGEEPVPVGINGRVMLIPRDKEVAVPLPYFRALEQAITFKYIQQVDERGNDAGLNPAPRKVPLYPFQLLSTPDEVKAAEAFWDAKNEKDQERIRAANAARDARQQRVA